MNLKTFLAMLQRDAHVARRNFIPLLAQTLLQPMMFVFLFGRVMTAIGLTLGSSIGQQHIGLMFSMVFAPMIFFGCTYYPWEALRKFPILSRAVLVNPVVYASEGFRSALVPQFQHLPAERLLIGLVVFNILFITVGLRQFRRKALT